MCNDRGRLVAEQCLCCFRWTFIIAAICCVLGILMTYFFVPNMTGKDLAEEDARFIEYLKDNGWEGAIGEDVDEDEDTDLLE